jgi:hypothetical protein
MHGKVVITDVWKAQDFGVPKVWVVMHVIQLPPPGTVMIMRGGLLWCWTLTLFLAVTPLLVLLLDPSVECILVTLLIQMIGGVPDLVNVCHAVVVFLYK